MTDFTFENMTTDEIVSAVITLDSLSLGVNFDNKASDDYTVYRDDLKITLSFQYGELESVHVTKDF